MAVQGMRRSRRRTRCVMPLAPSSYWMGSQVRQRVRARAEATSTPMIQLFVAETDSQVAPAAKVMATDDARGRSRRAQSLIVTSSGEVGRTRTLESRVGRMEE